MGNNLLAEGDGKFKVIRIYRNKKDGSPMVSSKGDPMVMIMFSVTDTMQTSGTVYEYFTPNTNWKSETLFKACNVLDSFNENFRLINWERLVDLTGFCKIATNGNNPAFPAKSVIAKFIYSKEPKKLEAQLPPMQDDSLEDICPF